LKVDEGDVVRVIGTFSQENNYLLKIDDNYDDKLINKASLIIVEPHILVPPTTITGCFPCHRKAFLGSVFKGGPANNINYACTLGNIVHEVF
jgi:hypothetical protein